MSVGFELATQGGANVFDTALTTAKPATDLSPGVFDGFGKAIAYGVNRGGAMAARGFSLAGAVPFIAADKMSGGTELQDRYFRDNEVYQNAVEAWTPKPHEVGAAGRIVGGLAEMVLPLMAGGGNPSLLIANAQLGTGQDLVRQGVDAEIAQAVGLTHGAATAVGFKIPFLGNTLAKKVLFGATSNPALGAGAAGFSAKLLADAGYTKEAGQFDAMDAEARLTEALIGAVFGGVAHRFNPKGERLIEPAPADHPISKFFAELLPTQRDAVLGVNNARHVDESVAPGRARTTDAKNENVDAFEQAIAELDEAKTVTAKVDPAGFDPVPRREVVREAVGKALDVERGAPFDPPVHPKTREFIDASDLAPEAKARLHELYDEAAARKPEFDRTVADVADAVGGVAKLAELTGGERTVGEVRVDYKGDPNQMKDILRAIVEVNDGRSAMLAVDALIDRFNVMERGRRNLLDPSIQPEDGYRDAKMNVLIDGHVAEVQVNLPEMLAAKKIAHKPYEKREAIKRKAEEAGRDLTAKEQAAVDRLNAEMRAIYDPVWESIMSRNAASEIGAPLRSADSEGNLRGGEVSQAAQNSPGTPALRDTGIPSTSKNSARGGNTTEANSTAGEARSISDTSGEILAQGEIQAADAAIAANPGLEVMTGVDSDGNPVTAKASDLMARADEAIRQAETDAKGFEAAVNCFLRG